MSFDEQKAKLEEKKAQAKINHEERKLKMKASYADKKLKDILKKLLR